MSTLISSAVAATALAASLGAGPAAVPASAATVTPTAFNQAAFNQAAFTQSFNQNGPQRPNPPHRFRLRFTSLQQCRARAAHDHPGRPGDWDCRRGPDRNNPWEYWGN